MNWFSFDFQDFAVAFLSILLEGIPYVLFGTLLSGIIDAMVPSHTMTKFLPKNATAAIFVCGGLGIIFPMCECGIVPVIRRLIGKGLPVSCGIAYMLAAPIVNPVVAISTFAAFRGQDPMMMTSMRMVVAFGVAVLVGWIADRFPVEKILRKKVLDSMPKGPGQAGLMFEPVKDAKQEGHGVKRNEVAVADRKGHWREKLGIAVRTATTDFLDVSMYLVIGAAITSVFNTAVQQQIILPLAMNAWVASFSMMSLSGILSLCSTSDAFIAATFVAFPAAAKLAFLVFGPMMDLKLVFLYSSVFSKRFVFVLAIGLFILIGVICVRLTYLGI